LSAQFAMPAVVSAIHDLVTESGQVEEPPAAGAHLRAMFEQVTDPRDRRGRRHTVAAILMLVQAAVVSGATTFAAIKHWIRSAPAGVLADCGILPAPRTGIVKAPHPDTVSRLLVKLDPAELDLLYARHRSAQMSQELYEGDELIGLAVDGKAMRGTARDGAQARHRMGAFLHEDAIMVATCDVDGKTNEINAFEPLLDQIADLENIVVTGDAMHTQRKHARYLHKRKAHYVFPVLGNQPGLFDQLDALTWTDIPIGWMTYDRGHGRQEIRTIQTMPAPKSIRFPHAQQVFLIERHIHDLAGKPLSSIAVLGVTDLTAAQSGPRRFAEFVRSQWSIENRDHYVRDVTFGEDRCQIRAAATPSILATMRSYAISTLRLLGFTNIAEAARWARDDFTHPITALHLT
jgi:predicted transposase YbfD/YdcC